MAVASNRPQFYVDRFIVLIGVKDYLESIWGSDGPIGRPAPDVYLANAKGLCKSPGAYLVIEDSPASVSARKQLG